MNDFEILQNLSIGQYRPGTSFLHTMNPALKLAALVLVMILILLSPFFPQLPIIFLLLIVTARLSGHGIFSLLRGTGPVLPFLIIIVLIQMFLIPRAYSSDAIMSLGRFEMHREDLIFTAKIFGRFFCLFLLFTLFTTVTTVSEISHGAEILFRPFGRKRAFSHDLSLVITITFRFIPILAMEAEHITKAQASRGGSFGTWKMGLLKKIRLYIPLLVPLFIAALERAETLVEAMEARCYEAGQERSRLTEYVWTVRDTRALTLLILFTILLLGSRFIFSFGGNYV
ncbi:MULTISPECIES: energy-coupling factor transporter transmembrane protein EcfT [unclassified Oceanispirochaeta]|uniref:energy-coupling factor transporter transmembrane component T family protein n=1 Tax=unclassified Oceanispirochaeta TaxID=2635722 RepID=UPI000E0951E6|nr:MULTISPECIES: energy-coupling factor transporter transmembrane component T [unclassified Oceanispirochaeta]MBF9014107.1 energy-coupling factor transporter transmembrane protein EcfT [Oceanispirochaeta sp. M2]NPD70598.1 energy-coupling factor transporter transmembrane protein EcfT [Oceanispirochaeta sp. M1]RDG34363.1 energy-coupling factor transporter transmembrane protein EcfT [Oceanispirochaeta sp. M1]